MIEENYISVIDASNKFGARKQTFFKWIKQLGIEPIKSKNSSHKGQLTSYITLEEFDRLIEFKEQNDQNLELTRNSITIDHGVFYLIQLEPDLDPGRYKLGFASNIAERIRKHKCVAPFAKLIQTWPCHVLWERTGIDSISIGSEKLYTEVFRTNSIDEIKLKCSNFFELMPSLENLKK